MSKPTTTPNDQQVSTYVQVMTEGLKIDVPPELMKQMLQNVLTGAMSDAIQKKTSFGYLNESIEQAVDKLFSGTGIGRKGNNAGMMVEDALDRVIGNIVIEMIDENESFKQFVRKTFDDVLSSDEMRAKLRDRLTEKVLDQT